MISFLRFLGVANAAVWFGTAVFATFFAGPAFFSREMLDVFNQQRYYAGAVAEIFVSRYFLLHYLCGGLAIVHLFAERLYLGRQLTRFTVALWAVIVALTLFGGVFVQPKLRQLHHTMYLSTNTTERAAATKSFRSWHGASQAANLLVVGGLLFYFWRVTHPRRTWDASEI